MNGLGSFEILHWQSFVAGVRSGKALIHRTCRHLIARFKGLGEQGKLLWGRLGKRVEYAHL